MRGRAVGPADNRPHFLFVGESDHCPRSSGPGVLVPDGNQLKWTALKTTLAVGFLHGKLNAEPECAASGVFSVGGAEVTDSDRRLRGRQNRGRQEDRDEPHCSSAGRLDREIRSRLGM